MAPPLSLRGLPSVCQRPSWSLFSTPSQTLESQLAQSWAAPLFHPRLPQQTVPAHLLKFLQALHQRPVPAHLLKVLQALHQRPAQAHLLKVLQALHQVRPTNTSPVDSIAVDDYCMWLTHLVTCCVTIRAVTLRACSWDCLSTASSTQWPWPAAEHRALSVMMVQVKPCTDCYTATYQHEQERYAALHPAAFQATYLPRHPAALPSLFVEAMDNQQHVPTNGGQLLRLPTGAVLPKETMHASLHQLPL
jgi:hypothetical protein